MEQNQGRRNECLCRMLTTQREISRSGLLPATSSLGQNDSGIFKVYFLYGVKDNDE